VVDIIQALIQQVNYQTSRKYWNKLKERLKKEGNESVSNCHQLKFEVSDGKFYFINTADVETLQRTDYDESIILERASSYINNNENNI